MKTQLIQTFPKWLGLGVISLAGVGVLAGTKTGLNSFDFGNEYAGAKGNYTVTVENRPAYARTALAASGSVKFMKRTAKGVDFNATVENNNGKKSAAYSLRVAGYTVDTGSKAVSYTWSKGVNKTLIELSAQLMVGPVPVLLSGSVGGGASIGYTFELSAAGVGVSGQGGAWANGSASAGAGVKLLNLSLRSTLELGKTQLKPGVKVTPTTMSGQVNLVFDPVTIDLGVELRSLGKTWYRLDLAKYSAPSKVVTLIKL
jgi:hypothetical protein